MLDRVLEANRQAQHAWQVLWDWMPWGMSTDGRACNMRDAMGDLREACMAAAGGAVSEPDVTPAFICDDPTQPNHEDPDWFLNAVDREVVRWRASDLAGEDLRIALTWAKFGMEKALFETNAAEMVAAAVRIAATALRIAEEGYQGVPGHRGNQAPPVEPENALADGDAEGC
jgi:hypothetical protein